MSGGAGAETADEAADAASAAVARPAREPALHLEPLLLDVSLNGQQPFEGVYAARDSSGRIYVRAADARSWRLLVDPRLELAIAGEHYVALAALRGVSYRFSEATQALDVQAPPSAFAPAIIDVQPHELGPMTAPSVGAFINYDLFAERTGGRVNGGGLFEAGAFANGGIALASAVARSSAPDPGVVRLETSWTRDDPLGLKSLRIGDSISRGSATTAPFRFAGLQWGTNFAIRPGYLTLPVPVIGGSAALPSAADLYVNNVLASQRAVAPGAFEIVNPPIQAGVGDVRVVVRDPAGGQSVTTLSYYGAPDLLRQGLDDFSFEAGFLRRDFGERSFAYGPPVISGTYRYGLTNGVTVEAHGEATPDRQLVGGAVGTVLAGAAEIVAAGAASRSERGAGAIGSLTVQRRTAGLSFAGRVELATRDFAEVATAPDYHVPLRTVTASAAMPVGRIRVGANYLLRVDSDERHLEIARLSASVPIGGLGLLDLYAGRTRGDTRSSDIGLFLTFPLGRSLNASVDSELVDGDWNSTATVQRNVPAGDGYGFFAQLAAGAARRAEAQAFVHTATQAFEAGIWTNGHQTALRGRVTGSLAIVGTHAIAARLLADSFAVVETGGYKGVAVYADNQLVGRTNSAGIAVVPQLRSYDRNLISIDAGDLPVEAVVGEVEKVVRPYRRNGVEVKFPVSGARSALVRPFLANGAAIPSGAIAKIDGRTEDFAGTPDGQFFLTGLGKHDRVTIRWDGGSCEMAIVTPAGVSGQTDLGRRQCTVTNDDR